MILKFIEVSQKQTNTGKTYWFAKEAGGKGMSLWHDTPPKVGVEYECQIEDKTNNGKTYTNLKSFVPADDRTPTPAPATPPPRHIPEAQMIDNLNALRGLSAQLAVKLCETLMQQGKGIDRPEEMFCDLANVIHDWVSGSKMQPAKKQPVDDTPF